MTPAAWATRHLDGTHTPWVQLIPLYSLDEFKLVLQQALGALMLCNQGSRSPYTTDAIEAIERALFTNKGN